MTGQIIVDHSAKGTRTSYPLKSDVMAAFHEAVQNNQMQLAMEYLRFIVDELLERVSPSSSQETELLARVAVLEETVKSLKASLAPSRKVLKKEEDANV